MPSSHPSMHRLDTWQSGPSSHLVAHEWIEQNKTTVDRCSRSVSNTVGRCSHSPQNVMYWLGLCNDSDINGDLSNTLISLLSPSNPKYPCQIHKLWFATISKIMLLFSSWYCPCQTTQQFFQVLPSPMHTIQTLRSLITSALIDHHLADNLKCVARKHYIHQHL